MAPPSRAVAVKRRLAFVVGVAVGMVEASAWLFGCLVALKLLGRLL